MKLLLAVPLVLVQLSCAYILPKREPDPVDLCLSSPQHLNNAIQCPSQDIKK